MPPPRTPNLPAIAGSAKMARTALPPLRLRSTPQPQRMTRGRRGSVGVDQGGDVALGDVADLGGAGRADTAPPAARVSKPVGMCGNEGAVGAAAADQLVDHRQRQHDVGARQRLQVQAGAACQRRAARIDHRNEGAGAPRGVDLRHQMDAGGRRIHAPQDDGAGQPVVLRRHPPMVPYMARLRVPVGAAQSVLNSSEAPRRLKKRASVGAFAEDAVRAAVVIRQDRLRAVGGDDLFEALGDDVERLVPADAARNAPSPFGADAALRVVQRAAASRRAPDSAAPWRR